MEETIKPGAPTGVLEASAPPLDYSFKELRSCSEMEMEEPRGGARRRPPAEKDPAADTSREGAEPMSPPAANATQVGALLPAGGKQPGASVTPKRTIRKVTVAVKLNNNMIETLSDLPQSLEPVMDNPLFNCQWLDLSYNQLTSIEPALLQFQQLKALYLHGNQIKSLASIERLRKLPKLISLTTNGNPIERVPSYRLFVIGALPTLRSLDHSTITQEERTNAKAAYEAHLVRAKAREEAKNEAAMSYE
jgi:hypothetical protein